MIFRLLIRKVRGKQHFKSEQELNITPKPTKNKTKGVLKATQAKRAKEAKEAKMAKEAKNAKEAKKAMDKEDKG